MQKWTADQKKRNEKEETKGKKHNQNKEGHRRVPPSLALALTNKAFFWVVAKVRNLSLLRKWFGLSDVKMLNCSIFPV